MLRPLNCALPGTCGFVPGNCCLCLLLSLTRVPGAGLCLRPRACLGYVWGKLGKLRCAGHCTERSQFFYHSSGVAVNGNSPLARMPPLSTILSSPLTISGMDLGTLSCNSSINSPLGSQWQRTPDVLGFAILCRVLLKGCLGAFIMLRSYCFSGLD